MEKVKELYLESLLEEHLILDAPLVREGGEVGEVLCGTVQVMLVPEQHTQGLHHYSSYSTFMTGSQCCGSGPGSGVFYYPRIRIRDPG